MSLEGFDVRGPRVKFEILGGPKNLTAKDLEARLVRFEYRDEPGNKKSQRPKVLMDFDNSDGKILNVAVPIVGLKLKISFGYPGNYTKPFIAVIRRIKANLIREESGRAPTQSPAPNAYGLIQIEGRIEPIKLHYRPGEDVGTFRNMRMSQIARQIARRQGFKERNIFIQDTLPGGVREPIEEEISIETHETVRQFLMRKAEERGFVFRTVLGEFHFYQPGFRPEAIEDISFFKGPDVLEMQIDGDFNVNLQKVTGKAYNPKFGTATIFTASGDALGISKFKPDNVSLEREKIKPEDVVPASVLRVTEKALSRLANHIRRRWIIKLTLVGNPRLFAGMMMTLDNFGPFVDGRWYVHGVKHTVDQGGYTTYLNLRARYGKARARNCKPIGVFNPSGFAVGILHVCSGNPYNYLKKKRKKRKRRGRPFPAKSPRNREVNRTQD